MEKDGIFRIARKNFHRMALAQSGARISVSASKYLPGSQISTAPLDDCCDRYLQFAGAYADFTSHSRLFKRISLLYA